MQNDCGQGIKLGDNSSFCRWGANADYGGKHCFAVAPAKDPCRVYNGNELKCKAAVATLAFAQDADGWVDANRKLCSYRNAPAVCEPRQINRCSGLMTHGVCAGNPQCEWRH